MSVYLLPEDYFYLRQNICILKTNVDPADLRLRKFDTKNEREIIMIKTIDDKKENKNEKESFLEYMKDLLIIFFEFLKIGSVSFGGGLAIVRVYECEFVDKKKWLTKEELYDYYFLSQVTPNQLKDVMIELDKEYSGMFKLAIESFALLSLFVCLLERLFQFCMQFLNEQKQVLLGVTFYR